VGWGSTLDVAREALARCGRNDISFLHYRQVYPLPAEGNRYLMEAPVLIALENNATGQFADLVESLVPVRFAGRILKYDGTPFTVEELAGAFGNIENRGRR
jgi:2-oxoglutarate ferredoxin oxidoreductase subunit alpha